MVFWMFSCRSKWHYVLVLLSNFRLIKGRKFEIVSFPEVSTSSNSETGITCLNKTEITSDFLKKKIKKLYVFKI